MRSLMRDSGSLYLFDCSTSLATNKSLSLPIKVIGSDSLPHPSDSLGTLQREMSQTAAQTGTRLIPSKPIAFKQRRIVC